MSCQKSSVRMGRSLTDGAPAARTPTHLRSMRRRRHHGLMTARPLPPEPHHQFSTEPHHQQLAPESSRHQRPQESHHRLFPVPYGATAERPGWADLPSGLRSAVAERLGAPVLGARTATGGFTPGFAAVLDLGPTGSVFVKAAGLTGPGNLAA